ncbi:MAG TPA: SDR family oxidoreductase [Caulobacteraceae bacterium]
MKIDLSGQTILVTGASRGIGAAIAGRLAQSGAQVAVHYGRNRDAAETFAARLGGGARAFGADLSDPSAGAGLWTKVEQALGPVNGLVNNAGVAVESPLDAPLDAWLDGWSRTLAVNLTAPAVLCRAAVAHFVERGGGRIINVASRAAFRGDQPDYLAYAASKAGLVALTKSIARGFGKQEVKAFALAPGFTRTDMAQAFIDRYGEDHAAKDIALPRLTEPDDIGPMAAFLLSGLADHATGATFDLNAASYVR